MRTRRIILSWLILVFVSLACQTILPVATETAIPATPVLSATQTILLTETAQPLHTETATPVPSQEPTLTAAAPSVPLSTDIPSENRSGTFEIRYHPDGGLYIGDLVSIEVIPTREQRFANSTLTVSTIDGTEINTTEFGRFGIGGRYQATLTWAWDTSDLPPGEHTLNFSIHPGDIEFQDTVTFQPAAALPFPGEQASWSRYESDCCLYYTISGTAADRDIETIMNVTDFQAERLTERMGVEFGGPVEITLLPRVLGHGGFARGEIFVTYMDRKYVGGMYQDVIHHEMVHILDGRLESGFRPTMFAEGLAVYLTGGHFKQEPLLPRAAALLPPDQVSSALGLDWYIPLRPLANNFYTSQHEIGYLQAGALVEYIVERWGYTAFDDFYRSISRPEENQTHTDVINQALIAHFDLDFDQLEADFIERLQDENVTQDFYDDVRLMVKFYDTARRYQQLLDPSAYFLTAWLPDGPAMRDGGIVDDFLRHPEGIENIALETMLVYGDQSLQQGDYQELEEILIAANQVMNAIEAGDPQPFSVNPLSQDHYQISQAVLAAGYYPFLIDVEQGEAYALATYRNQSPAEFILGTEADSWVIQSLND